jgi:transposase
MFYPARDFDCPHKNSCPHLDWLSTKWVFEQYRHGYDTYQEHMRIFDRFDADSKNRNEKIRQLERENAELKAKLTLLHKRQFKPNKKKTESDPAVPAKSNKKLGAPVGHPAWIRPKPNRIDRTVFVPAPTVCPHCRKGDLIPSGELHEHIQEDIVIEPRTVVTCYQHGQSFCSRCHRLVVQAAEDEIPNAPIGPVAKSVAIYLRYRIGISYRKTAELFRDLFGMSFVPASAVGFDRKASELGAPLHDDLREKIRVSDMVHADETSWRNNGLGHYAWFAGNEDLAFFHIVRHRSGDVAKSIFGDRFEGVLVRDRYAAYNGIGREWQSCLAHIITKAKELRKEHALLPKSEQESATERFCNRVEAFFKRACETAAELKSGKLSWESAKNIEQDYAKRLSDICKKPLSFKPAETLRAFLSGEDQKFLFTFLRNPGVPPTNNHAEQSIRHLVIFRKIFFGTRSENGLKSHSILPSLIQTARRQGVHPRQFIQTLLTADTPAAQAALYNNSS